jgi:hypothetical protein
MDDIVSEYTGVDGTGRDEFGNVVCEACALQHDEAIAELDDAEQAERVRSCNEWNAKAKAGRQRAVEATRSSDDSVIAAARREASVMQLMGVKRVQPVGNIRHALNIIDARRSAV